MSCLYKQNPPSQEIVISTIRSFVHIYCLQQKYSTYIMEHIVIIIIITVLTITIHFSSASSSLHLPLMPQPSLQIHGALNANQVSVSELPRRLRFTQLHKQLEARDLASHNKVSPGEKEKIGKKGRKEERMMEGDDHEDELSQYFTMDYSRVRRRRPIHNKHISLTTTTP